MAGSDSVTTVAPGRHSGLRFILPSLAGFLVFLTPIPWQGELTIGIGIITGWIKALMGDYGLLLVVTLITLASVLTFAGTLLQLRWIERSPLLRELFTVSPVWMVLRACGALFGLAYCCQVGPAVLISEEIGGAVYVDIGVNVLSVYIAACLFLPLLTDFGFMEFAGTLARPVFSRVFRLPGRAAIDATASFVGASAIGLLITIRQYDQGFYTAREASVIATNFSIVSIPFSLVIANVAGIGHLFITWYACVVVACLLAALITPRLPPLSRQANNYVSGGEAGAGETQTPTNSLLAEAMTRARDRAASSPDVVRFLQSVLSSMMFFVFSVMGAALALATVAALITFHTPLMSWLGTPFVYLLELASFPEANKATAGLFSGYLDQFMPALVASSIDSTKTSFVLAGLSVCQLIFMSECGVIILRSSLPLRVRDLTLIFLLRTLITLPVLMAGALVIA
ncbi:MAG: YjiH family protein [Halioglobus sp.]